MKKVFVFGAAGRVGLGLVGRLLQRDMSIVAADLLDTATLTAAVNRLAVDARLSGSEVRGRVSILGGVDVLSESVVAELLAREKPDVVVNYAIPFTWDATKRLPNYAAISRAGLGAFAAVQVLAPMAVARGLSSSGVAARYVVGNLPDITIPIIHGLANHQPLARPVAGAGNVGLIEAGLKHHLTERLGVHAREIAIGLVAHHVHWVVPREPGYRNDAPFMLRVARDGEDLTPALGDLRELLNSAIASCYEPGAGFSSTTSLLAAELVSCLLDETDTVHELHLPAPGGLPGGYPTIVRSGAIELNLPSDWDRATAVDAMRDAQRRDGLDRIGEDGTIHFNPQTVDIIRRELGFPLPEIVPPGDLVAVAREQIRVARQAVSALG